MKSIQNQYNDLKEGKMSQANFMRNLRMAMPQYVTNVTSFQDAIKILKNKSILSEGMMEKDPIETEDEDEIDSLIKKYEDEAAGEEAVKAQYDMAEDHSGNPNDKYIVKQSDEGTWYVWEGDVKVDEFDSEEEAQSFADEKNAAQGLSEGKGKNLHPNQIHPQELRMGIQVEMEHTDDPKKAEKIALDHLAENPFYYTMLKVSGVDSPVTEKPKAKKVAKKKTESALVDKENGMKVVKDVAKVKASSNKAHKETNKATPGITLMSLISKSVRGVGKMAPTGEKFKKIFMKENIGNEEPTETTKRLTQFINGNSYLKSISNELDVQQSNGTTILRYGYWDELPQDAINKLELQFDLEVDRDFDEDTGELIMYRITGKPTNTAKTPGEAVAKALTKEDIAALVNEVLNELKNEKND